MLRLKLFVNYVLSCSDMIVEGDTIVRTTKVSMISRVNYTVPPNFPIVAVNPDVVKNPRIYNMNLSKRAAKVAEKSQAAKVKENRITTVPSKMPEANNNEPARTN